MKNATDLSNTITTQHGVMLPSSAKPTISVKAKGKKRQDEDESQSEQNNSETADVTAEAAADASESSTMDSPMQLAAANTGEEATAGAVQNSAGGAGKSQANDGDANPIWLPLGALALGGIVAGAQGATVAATGGSAAPATGFSVSGSVVLGPVVAGHNLSVVAFRADGTELKRGTVNADGTYTLTITENYTGAILLRLIDSADGNDYRDEATGEAQDLTTDLRAVSVVSGPGSYTININPVTELAVRQLNMAGGDNGTSAVNLSGISVADIDTANSNIANALGLDGVNIVTGTVVAAIRADGTANPEANGFGLVLAAISGMESGSDATTDEILSYLTQEIDGSETSTEAVNSLIAGVADAQGRSESVNQLAEALGLSSGAATEAANAWNAVHTAADSVDNNAPAPTQSHYAAIGVSGVDTTAIASLLGDVIDIKSSAAIDTVAELQSLADVVGRLMLHAAGTLQVITQSELESLGVNGLNPARLADLLDKINLSSVDGSGIDTLAKLQALVDTVAPTAPTIGTLTGDSIINASEVASNVTITGNNEEGTRVTLLIGGVERFADVTGSTWTYTLTEDDITSMGEGEETITVTQTDAAGNTSTEATLPIRVDTAAPSAPTIDPVTEDNTINSSEREVGVTLTGTCEAGATVTLRIGDEQRLADVSGSTWSYTLTEDDIAIMGEGEETITVTQTDAAGNTSTEATLPITVDTVGPESAPSVNDIAIDNFINASEVASNVTITGNNEEGTTVTLLIGGRERVANVSGSAWSYTLTEEDIASMGEGVENITVTQTDAAGNTSSEVTRPITVDTVIPAVPTINPVAVDNLINSSVREGGVTLTGTNEAGGSLTLHIGGANRVIRLDGTTWSYTLVNEDFTNMGNGPRTLTLTQTDAAGNTSPEATLQIMVDTDVPPAPTINAVAENNFINNSERADGITLTGNCEESTMVTLRIGGVERVADVSGSSWSYTLTDEDIAIMGEGEETITATQTDAAGNTSAQATHTFTVDTVAPVAPTIDPVAENNVINSSERDRGVTLTGTCEAGATMVLNIGGANHTFTAEGSTWSYTLSSTDFQNMGNGPDAVTVTQTDAAGNTGPSATLEITVDTNTPNAPTLDPVASDSVINISERDGGVTLSGSNEEGVTVSLRFGNAQRSATVDGFRWSYTLTREDLAAMGQGGETISITQTDAAGNTSPAVERLITIDTIAPLNLSIDPVATDNFINSSERNGVVTLTGTNEAQGSLTLNIGGANRVIEVSGTTWSYTLTEADFQNMRTGPQTLTLTQTDLAGNTSTAARNITIDTDAPSAPTINPVTVDNVINSSERDGGVTLIGTCEAGATVTLFIGGVEHSTFVSGTSWRYGLSAAEVNAMGQGTETITAIQTDAAGNTSAALTHTFTVDTAAPVAPNINPVTVDNAINISEREGGVTLTGSNEAGATVALRIGGEQQTALVSGTTWSYTLSLAEINAMGQGTEAITVTQTDAAGNTSAQATHTFTVDTVAPVAPTINPVAANNVINSSEREGGVTLTGTCEAGATMVLNIGGANRTFTSEGTTWSYALVDRDFTNMGNGQQTLTVTQTDAAGNTGPSATLEITVDTTTPNAPTLDPVASDSVINISERDGGVTLSGSNEEGVTVSLRFGNVQRSATVDGFRWSYTLTREDLAAMGQGGETISITQTDAAGNTSPAIERLITIDTIAPLNLSIDPVATDNFINSSEREGGVTLTGTCESGTTMVLNIGGANRTFTAEGTTWSYTISSTDFQNMRNGPQTLTLTQTDLAGNTSTAARNITIDTDAPSAPTINPVTIDNVINSSEREGGVTLTGTCEAGATVTVLLGGVRQTATVTGTTWRYALSLAEVNAMGQGSEAIVVTQTDAAGNTSAALTHTFTVDTAAPSAPTINPVTANNVINSSEREGGVTLTGTCEAGATVTVLLGGVRQTATVTGTTWIYALSVAEVNAMGQGTEAIVLTQTDAAGNTSAQATHTFTVDTVAPVAPTINPVAANNVINISEREGGVTLTGTCEAGATMVLNIGGANRTFTAEGSTWSYTLSSTDFQNMGNGPDAVTVTQTDAAGNTGPSATLEITVDTDAPAAPTINPATVDNVINSNERDGGVTLTGTCEAGATVTVFIGGVERTADVSGTSWRYALSVAEVNAMDQGTETVSVTQTDAAGNTSEVLSRNITVDTITPTLPGMNVVADNNVINSSERDGGVTLTGSNEAGATVTVFIGGVERTADVSGTTWRYALSLAEVNAMGQGTETITATQTDAAGNTSAVVSRTITIDTIHPTVPTINIVASNDIIDISELDAGLVLTGTCEAGGTVSLNLAGTEHEVVVDGTTWSFVINAAAVNQLGQGHKTLTLTHTDAAGNTSTTTREITVDTVAPDAPTIDAVAGDNILNGDERNSSNVITGTNELGATVTLTIGGVDHAATVTGTTWSYTLNATDITIEQGTVVLTVSQTDTAGNTSAARTVDILVDTIAPEDPTIATVAGNNTINISERDAIGGVTVQGTNELDATIILRVGNADRQATVVGTTWSYVLSAQDFTNMGQGTEDLVVTQSDRAGNPSFSSRRITVDTIAPAVPTLNAIAGDNVISASERDASGGITITGTRESGARVTLNIGGVDRSATPASSATWSYVLTAAEVNSLSQGNQIFSVTQTDAAGNSSAPITRNITVDTVATGLAINSIAGNDTISTSERDAAGGVTVTGANEAGATVSLSFGSTTRNAVVSGANWSYALTAAEVDAMGQGQETITVTQTDALRNTSTTTRNITVDTVDPAAPTFNRVAGDDFINASEIQNGVTLSGNCEQGATVTLLIKGEPRITTVTGTTWTYTLTALDIDTIGSGGETFRAIQTDAAGNISAEGTHTIRVDTEPTPPPEIFAVTGDDHISANERAEGVILSGGCDAEGTLTLHFGGVDRSITVTDTSWSYALTDEDFALMGEGAETLLITQTDLAGNISDVVSHNITVNTTTQASAASAAATVMASKKDLAAIWDAINGSRSENGWASHGGDFGSAATPTGFIAPAEHDAQQHHVVWSVL